MSAAHPAGLEGAIHVCRTLEALGVRHVLGVPGTQTVPLYEAIRKSKLESIVPSSELAAAFMAGAYFRVCGEVAAVVTIPGPGFTWALTGLAEARADSAALLHLTLAEPQGPGARFGLQAIPQRTVGSALTKGVFTVESIHEIEPILREAHALAMSREPGPVIVALGSGGADGSEASSDLSTTPEPVDLGGKRDPSTGSTGLPPDLSDTWRRLRGARRPLIYAGQGALGAAPALLRLAEALGAPVMTTPSGRGIVPETHPLSMPFDPCRGGLDAASALLERADLILVLGARLGHNGSAGHALPFDPARAVQIDASPANCGVAYGIPGVVARVEDWIALAPSGPLHPSEWVPEDLGRVRRALLRPPAGAAEPTVAGGRAEAFFSGVRRALPPNGRMVTDTGLHQILARRYFDVLRPAGLLLPSDFQSMGFGLPAAMGAKLADPSVPVVALVGDGSLAMNGLELATAARLGLSLPVIVFVDGYLNQIRVQQQREIGHASGVELPTLDLEALADAVGVSFDWVQDPEAALRIALKRDGPTLLAVEVGDSPGMKRALRRRRVRNAVKRAVGQRFLEWVRGRGR